MSHIFFGNALRESWFYWFSTHPDLTERIRVIEPSFDGKFPKVDPVGGSPGLNENLANLGPKPRIPPGFEASSVLPFVVNASSVVNQIGKLTATNMERARAFIEMIPEPLKEASHNPAGARALIFALLLSAGKTRLDQLSHLSEKEGELFANQVSSLHEMYEKLGPKSRLPLVDLSLPALRRLSESETAQFVANMKSFLAKEENLSLSSFVIVKALRRHIVRAKEGRPSLSQFYSIQPILPDCSTVLSALAYHGNDSDQEAVRDFSAGISRLGLSDLPMIRKENCDVKSISRSLDRISKAVPRLKQRLVDACATASSVDGVIRPEEAELIRAVADTLDCPLPPLLATRSA